MTGRAFSFEINRTTRAPASTLFRLETDGAGWSRWAKPLIVQSSWEQPGDGVGAIRKVGVWPMLMREKTVVYEQDRRHVYEQIGPRLPAKNYRAEVLLTPNAGAPTCTGQVRSPRAFAGAARSCSSFCAAWSASCPGDSSARPNGLLDPDVGRFEVHISGSWTAPRTAASR